MKFKIANFNFLVLILFIFFFIIIYFFKLETIPASFHGDEAETAIFASEIIKNNINLIGVGWADQPILAFLPHVIGMKIFGVNIFGDRIGSAIFGILTLPVFYFFTKNLFNKHIALTATILFGTSHLWIALSRLGIIYVQATFLIIGTLYFLLRGLKEEKTKFFITAGIFLGLSFYSYYAVRILPLLILIIVIPYLLKKNFIKNFKRFLIFLFVSSIIILSQALFFLNHPQNFFSRTNTVFIFSEIGKEWTNYNKSNFEIIVEQTKKTFNIFAGDNSTQYGYKGILIDYLTLAFLFLGIIYIFIKRSFTKIFILSWLILALLAQIFTTIPTPIFLPRFVIGLPALYIICAFGVEFLFKILPKRKLFNMSFLILLMIIIFQNLNLYFIQYPKQLEEGVAGGGFHELTPLRIINFIDQFPSNKIFFLTKPYLYSDYGSFRFLSKNKQRYDISTIEESFALKNQNGNIYILYPENEPELKKLQQKYPDGKVFKFYTKLGKIEFLAFRI